MNSRRYWLIVSAISLVVALVTLVVIKAPRTVPLEQCSEVYRRYHDTPGIQASFIRNKRINDTVAVDMTMLVADDSLAFVNLLKIWNFSDEFVADLMSSATDENTRFVKLLPIGHPELPKDRDTLMNNEIVTLFPVRRTVAVFHPKTENEQDITKNANFFNKVNL